MKQLTGNILRFRSYLYDHREWFYFPFILGVGWAKSFGLSFQDRPYMILFVVTVFLMGIKLVITNYTWRELLLIAVTGILLVRNFPGNHDPTLLTVYLAVIGAKGIDLDRVFRYSLWPKAILTALCIGLATAGIIENSGDYIGKVYGTVYLQFYGFDNANVLCMNITAILLLAFLVYRDKMKWYAYILAAMVLAATFPYLQCKSALGVWAVFCILSIFGWISRKLRIDGIYLRLCAVIPLALCGLCYGGAVWYRSHPGVADRILNLLFNGRIQLTATGLYDRGQLKFLSGMDNWEYFDIAFFHIAFNYGWVVLALWLSAYVIAMWQCARRKDSHAVLVLASISFYTFMEFPAVNALWNVPLLYLAWALYPEDAVLRGQTQE